MRELEPIGPASNHIFVHEGDVFYIESQQNTVTRYLPSERRVRLFADLGEGANPYDAALGPDRLWVTNYLRETVSGVDLQTGEVELTLEDESLRNPEGVVVDGELVWVTNANYLSPVEGFGPGSISLFDRQTGARRGVIEVEAKNVQFADRIESGGNAYIVVVASGAVEFVDGQARATSDAVVYRWPAGAAAPQEIVPASLMIPAANNAAPGRPVHLPGTSKVYLSSGTRPNIYAFDVDTMTWLIGPDAPLELYDTDGDALHHAAIDERGLLMVTAFNRDMMQLVDTRCDALLGDPIPLGVQDELLEGPHGVAPIGTSAYFILSVSNALGVVDFDFEP